VESRAERLQVPHLDLDIADVVVAFGAKFDGREAAGQRSRSDSVKKAYSR
jgi:hypothetical protein